MNSMRARGEIIEIGEASGICVGNIMEAIAIISKSMSRASKRLTQKRGELCR